jgi:hypothetical protein
MAMSQAVVEKGGNSCSIVAQSLTACGNRREIKSRGRAESTQVRISTCNKGLDARGISG